jgi:predicted ATPase
MITKIELTNFKSHAHTVIEPGRVTAIVGPNGAGKSSLLQAAYFLSQLRIEIPEKLYKNYALFSSLFRYRAMKAGIAIRGVERKQEWDLRIRWEIENTNGKTNVKTPLEWRIGEEAATISDLSPSSFLSDQVPNPLLKLLKAAYFKGVGKNLAEPSYSDSTEPELEEDGKGLASALAYLGLSDREAFDTAEKALIAIVPSVKRIKIKPAKINRKESRIMRLDNNTFPLSEERSVTGQEVFFDMLSVKDLPARAASDGTLLTLGVLTLLHHPNSPHLILVDDLEQGLHPLAQRRLMQVMKDFAEKHDRQIILTSHSPYIIDELDAKDVWVMATDKEGITHTKRLSEHPDAEKVLSVLTTGEFASAYDEEWVLDETQAAELVHG